MTSEYLPVGILVLFAVGFAIATLAFTAWSGQRGRKMVAKDIAYECGLNPLTGPHPRFSVKFYLVAMLFILFDVEVVFMYPWAVVYKDMLREGIAIFISMLTFLGILFLGFLYAWKKGAFDWK